MLRCCGHSFCEQIWKFYYREEKKKKTHPASFVSFHFYYYSFPRLPVYSRFFTFVLMDNTYTWIFIVGVIVFFLVIILLLCFTKAGGDRLFLGGSDDLEGGSEVVETPALLASLSEDARISYEQAKGNSILEQVDK